MSGSEGLGSHSGRNTGEKNARENSKFDLLLNYAAFIFALELYIFFCPASFSEKFKNARIYLSFNNHKEL